MNSLYYCCAEFAGFSVSEVHCEPDAAWSHYQVPAAPAQEEEAPQHQCSVPGKITLCSITHTNWAFYTKHTFQQQSWPFSKSFSLFPSDLSDQTLGDSEQSRAFLHSLYPLQRWEGESCSLISSLQILCLQLKGFRRRNLECTLM